MAEILPFTGQLSREGAERLTTVLAQAFASGADLGSRRSHIRALGLSLGSLVEALRAELDRLDDCLAGTFLSSSDYPEFRALLADFERFADLASAYRAADTPDVLDRPVS
ncbi:hypothetical protein MKK55_07690 [Methylobacterium sp. J-059]|jgi:hypothetical protein|uniref:hypothetical protein n=1 Tax=Methylobacterium sp. J-059 TaxID=2836643 RepID=UPI001FB8F7DD|nr:hypothetical protein [Methylobacterium sp. J-059]MCJ2038836.1 hypothetical protein [Methylobacterium sp. J-059]